MKRFRQTVAVFKRMAAFFTKRWYALVAPTETRDEKKIANYIKLVDATEKNYREGINWRIKTYQELGCSKKVIRAKVLPMIETERSNATILASILPQGLLSPPEENTKKAEQRAATEVGQQLRVANLPRL